MVCSDRVEYMQCAYSPSGITVETVIVGGKKRSNPAFCNAIEIRPAQKNRDNRCKVVRRWVILN